MSLHFTASRKAPIQYFPVSSLLKLYIVILLIRVLFDSRSGCEVSGILQVIEQTRRQINHFRRGLEETGIWTLLSHRRDVIPVLFPRESEAQVTPQVPHKWVHKIYPNS